MARQRRARGPRLHIVWTILLTLAVLAVPGTVAAWGRSMPAFTTERVVVTGTHVVGKKDARRTLEEAFLGQNLFAVGAGDVRRALQSQCYVARVEIDRDFPDTLRVRLVEHRPALAVLAGGRWFVVSRSGHVICEAPPKDAKDEESVGDGCGAENATGDGGGPAGVREAALPRLRVKEAPKPGRPAKDARVRAAVATLDGLPRALRRQVALVEVTAALRVTVTLRDGLVVRIGEAARLEDKVISLRAVRAAYRAEGRSPTYIDVSLPERPLGRPLLK